MEMEMEMRLPQRAIVAALFLLAFFFSLWIYQSQGKKKRRTDSAPLEVPGRWPIIGHLHKLGGDRQPLVRTLGALADKYGPLMTLWIGSHRTIVVSSWEMAKECYTTNDKALATRPLSSAGKYLCYNYKMLGFAQYGPFWRESRKIATIQLLSGRQLELLRHVRAREIDLYIKDLYKGWIEKKKVPIKVEMKKWFDDFLFNIMMLAVASKRYSIANSAKDEMEARKFRKLTNDFSLLSGNPIPSDAIPMLEWFDIGGHIRAMKKIFKGLDSLCSIWLEERRLQRLTGERGPDHDFLDVMLTALDNSHFSDDDTETFIKATSLTMVLTGSDTTSITLTWALSLLLNNRPALKKAQDELDTCVGNDRNVSEEDIENLPYLQAIVKETTRLYPAAPLAVPHEAMEDCSVGGFRIPVGIRVLINLWKIHRDPRIWTDPLKFLPERFLTTNADIDVRGQHFELIPFGSGRRMCPAISFALKLIHLTLARLLHAFDLHTPFDEPVDMIETPGLSVPKATPLEVLLTPRLSSHLYL
ncbi:cytochrome P450 CYP82D47-like [Aristolochia californica]|uniref:cytochrome P450 CYP82D47-like n=1 Tax=Aristolochia californica TaxID=171875 RepID=UPI0035DB1B13